MSNAEVNAASLIKIDMRTLHSGATYVLTPSKGKEGTSLNSYIQTANDILFTPFTHSARDDADLLYRHLAKDESIRTVVRTVSWAVFTDPQIGHFRLTEQKAREAGYEVGVGRQDFADQSKPKALSETEGFTKLVTNAETDELLGRISSANKAPRSSTNSSWQSNSVRQPTTSRTRYASTRPCRKALIPQRAGFTNSRERYFRCRSAHSAGLK